MSIQIEKRLESKDRRIIIKFYESLRMISKIGKTDFKRKGNSLTIEELPQNRHSSRPQVFLKISGLINFAKLTELFSFSYLNQIF